MKGKKRDEKKKTYLGPKRRRTSFGPVCCMKLLLLLLQEALEECGWGGRQRRRREWWWLTEVETVGISIICLNCRMGKCCLIWKCQCGQLIIRGLLPAATTSVPSLRVLYLGILIIGIGICVLRKLVLSLFSKSKIKRCRDVHRYSSSTFKLQRKHLQGIGVPGVPLTSHCCRHHSF